MKANLGIYINNRAARFLANYDIHQLLDAAVMCEELGFHSVWVGDSMLAKPRYKPIPVLSAVAARTKTIKLVTGILQPHLYNNPLLLALDWTTLDVLSGGRTILGVGIGAGLVSSIRKESEACGIRKEQRGRVFEETIEVVKRLWSEPEVTHHGRFFRLDGVALEYKPVQTPHPPVWIAAGIYHTGRAGEGPFEDEWRDEARSGYSVPVVDRVARLGDGWMTCHATAEEYNKTLSAIREVAAKKYGRDPNTIEGAFDSWINVDSNIHRGRQEARWILEQYHNMTVPWEVVDRYCIVGGPDDCIRELQSRVQAGVNTFELVIANRDQLGQMQTIAKEILPAFRDR